MFAKQCRAHLIMLIVNMPRLYNSPVFSKYRNKIRFASDGLISFGNRMADYEAIHCAKPLPKTEFLNIKRSFSILKPRAKLREHLKAHKTLQ